MCTDDEETHVLPGETGELLIKGPQVMLGYWNNDSATAHAVRDGWLYTGDLAQQLPNGFYRIVQRKKDLIITSGINVYPQEVEEALLTYPGVKEVAVVGIPDQERGEILNACFLMESNKQWKPEEIHAWCRENLSAQKRPRVIEHFPNGLPPKSLGKLLRR